MRTKALLVTRGAADVLLELGSTGFSAAFGTTYTGKHESKRLPPAENDDAETLTDWAPGSFL